MKNLDEIILESLKLINYNRGEILNEELPKPNPLIMGGEKSPFLIKNKALDLPPKKTPVSSGIYYYVTPSLGTVGIASGQISTSGYPKLVPADAFFISEKDYNNLLKMDERGRYNWINLQSGINYSKTQIENSRKKITSSYNKEEKNPTDYLLTLPSLETNNSIFIYPVENARISEYRYGFYKYKVSNIKKLGSFDLKLAEKFFGRQCRKLSGTHPNYNVGYDPKFDYYVNRNTAAKCYPIVVSQKEVEVDEKKGNEIVTKTYTERSFNVPTNTVTKLKNGNNIKTSKTKYENGCNPISYDSCLKLSWEMLSTYNNFQGVFEFTVDRYESSDEKKPISTRIYRATMTEEWFPWLNTFKGYVELDEDTKNKFGSWVLQRAETYNGKTGVQIIEDHLKTKNLSSDDYNCNGPFELNDEYKYGLKQWSYQNFLEKSNADTIASSTMNYKEESTWYLVRNVFTYWNQQNYYNVTGTIGDTELVNENPLDNYLNDFYGIGDKKMGSDEEFGQFYTIKDIGALDKKYDDIFSQKGNNIKSFLGVLAKDYKNELINKKTKSSSFLELYLKYKWDNTLQSFLFSKVTEASGDPCVQPLNDSVAKVWRMLIFLMSSGIKTNTSKGYDPTKGIFSGAGNLITKFDPIESCAKKTMNFRPGVSFISSIPLPKDITDDQLNKLNINENSVCKIEDGESKILNNSTIYFRLNGTSLDELGINSPVDFNMFGGSMSANQIIESFSSKSSEPEIDSDTEAFLKKQLEVYQQLNKEIDKFMSTHFVVPSRLIKT